MRKLDWTLIGNEIFIDEKDKQRVQYCIDNEIEMTIDEFNRVFDEGGNYIADIREEE